MDYNTSMNKELEFKGSVFINKNGEGFLGEGRYQLLKLIDRYGSLSKAAKDMNMSYKHAWDQIQAINNLSEDPVVITQAGGKSGGFTYLTDYGKKLLRKYEQVIYHYEKFLELLENEDLLESFDLIRRLDMKFSARNQLLGKVEEIITGEAVSEVVIRLKNGLALKSVITTEAVKSLGLGKDDNIIAIIKSSDVILGVGDEAKNIHSFSVRNVIKGKVKYVLEDAVNSHVKVDIGDDIIISSVITTESLKELDIKEGTPVFVIVKASNIMIYKL